MEFFFGIAGIWFAIEWIDFALRDENSSDVPKIPKSEKKHWWSSRGGKESGLRVYTDNATGVQYIKASMFDKLQVRINKDGSPYTGE